MSKKKALKKKIRKLRQRIHTLTLSIERFPQLVSGCFTYSGMKFHVNKEGLIYQDTDIPGYECAVCKLKDEQLTRHWKEVEMSFLYGNRPNESS